MQSVFCLLDNNYDNAFKGKVIHSPSLLFLFSKSGPRQKHKQQHLIQWCQWTLLSLQTSFSLPCRSCVVGACRHVGRARQYFPCSPMCGIKKTLQVLLARPWLYICQWLRRTVYWNFSIMLILVLLAIWKGSWMFLNRRIDIKTGMSF